ncbi:M15 family metallopeptidase [Sellimonas catena]|uniref:D-Ala-D-Ala carboxypeptidase VanY n=1 Tax=Sellimonas catena TaxID=2994035 RepID=A0A9W6FIB3_9FIRM|nr:M15 family metallopeptidase [Sellimonas catena]GLG90967.1 D-Ala-D-Ala carboxypeptidase VanY [Sellimonas catena]
MKDQTKEKIRKLELLIRYRIRKMHHPGKVFFVSCATVLVAGFLGGVALGRYVESRQAAETVQKKDNQYESLEKEYNSVKEQAEAQNEETRPWYLMLVNQSHPMEDGYVPELANIDDSHQVDARVLEPLQNMLKAASDEGYSLYVCSAYRSVDRQKELFNESMIDYVNQGMTYYEAAIETAKSIAWPGESEHATGLAMDIVSSDYAGLDEKQGETDDQKWLMEHCYEYGFILRYPKDKSEDTGIIYEPWHYRYVGVEAALAIRDQGVTMEEYLNEEY